MSTTTNIQTGLQRPYLFSWKFLVSELCARIVLAVVGIAWSASGYVFHRRVIPTDWSKYAYPFEETQVFPETLTVVYLVCFWVVTTACIGAMLRFRGKWPVRMLLEEFTLSILGFSLCILMTWVIGEVVKRMFGRLRPDFLARCFGHDDPAVWMAEQGWSSWNDIPEIPNCPFPHISHYDQVDGRQSFPSAHSGMTSTAMVYLALWLYTKLTLFRNMGAWRIVIPAIYMGFAVAVAVSRTSDYRHHPSDVIAGLILGSSMAIVAAVFYFPMKLEPIGKRVYKIRASNSGAGSRLRRPRLRYRSAAKFDSDTDDEGKKSDAMLTHPSGREGVFHSPNHSPRQLGRESQSIMIDGQEGIMTDYKRGDDTQIPV